MQFGSYSGSLAPSRINKNLLETTVILEALRGYIRKFSVQSPGWHRVCLVWRMVVRADFPQSARRQSLRGCEQQFAAPPATRADASSLFALNLRRHGIEASVSAGCGMVGGPLLADRSNAPRLYAWASTTLAAIASTSILNSGRVKPETIMRVEAGGGKIA